MDEEVFVFFEIVDIELARLEVAGLGLVVAGGERGDEFFGNVRLLDGGVEHALAVWREVDVLGGLGGDFEHFIGEGEEELLLAVGDLLLPRLEEEGELTGDVGQVRAAIEAVGVDEIVGRGEVGDELGGVGGPEEVGVLVVKTQGRVGDESGAFGKKGGAVGEFQEIKSWLDLGGR